MPGILNPGSFGGSQYDSHALLGGRWFYTRLLLAWTIRRSDHIAIMYRFIKFEGIMIIRERKCRLPIKLGCVNDCRYTTESQSLSVYHYHLKLHRASLNVFVTHCFYHKSCGIIIDRDDLRPRIVFRNCVRHQSRCVFMVHVCASRWFRTKQAWFGRE